MPFFLDDGLSTTVNATCKEKFIGDENKYFVLFALCTNHQRNP